jgi:hypothetical protein
MRIPLKIVILTFVLSLLLVSPYLHGVRKLALAQSGGSFSGLTYLPISGKTEQLSVVPLPSGGPSARHAHTAIKDELNHAMIIFGGSYFDVQTDSLYRYNDVWKLDLNSHTWTQITTSGTPPPPVSGHTAIYDALEHRMLVFGGGIDNGILNDVYELDLDSYTWNLLSTTGQAPSPRWEHCAVYNSQDHTMAIFGGRDLYDAFNDLWVLDLSTLVWQRIAYYGPSPRIGASAIYLPDRNSMLVFAGSNHWVEPWPYTTYNDVWEFNFDTQNWILHSTLGPSPPPRTVHMASYDGRNNRMLIFAGQCNYDIIVNDLWELDLSTWTWHELFPTLARDNLAGIFDEFSQELVFFGGGTDGKLYMYDDGFRILISSGSPTFGNGDVNCDGARNSADVVYLINYLFMGGPEPCANR